MPSTGELVNVLVLLVSLTGTSYASQALVTPLFGKTFGSTYFHSGIFVAFLLCSFIRLDADKQQRRALGILSFLQVATAVIYRSAGAYALSQIDDPTHAALAVHSLLGFPMIGLAGAVWLHWMNKFADPEPTRLGRLTVRVFTCIALATIVKYVEPLIGNTILEFANFTPKATLICLATATYALSVTFGHDRTISQMQQLTKVITIVSLFIVMLAVSVPPHTPAALAVQYERFTPSGLVQVVDNYLSIPATRYLRLDASVVGVIEISSEGELRESNSAAVELLDAVRLVRGTKGKHALIFGVQTGTSAKLLMSHSYNTTIVDENRAVYDAARSYFALPEPESVFIEDPSVWASRNVDKVAVAQGGKYDIVVHDVFEGGELPAKLFTMEFWTAVRSLMDNAGVIAIKYVGKPNAVTFKSTLNMLQKTFATCRAYHSNPPAHSPLVAPEGFAEVVIFCTPAESLNFHTASTSDFSPKSLAVLSVLEQREISIAAALGETSPERYLLKTSDPVMSRWGRDSVKEYWKLMRQRFPESVWSSY